RGLEYGATPELAAGISGVRADDSGFEYGSSQGSGLGFWLEAGMTWRLFHRMTLGIQARANQATLDFRGDGADVVPMSTSVTNVGVGFVLGGFGEVGGTTTDRSPEKPW